MAAEISSKTEPANDSVSHRSPLAVVLMDVITDFRWTGGEELAARARAIVPAIQQLRRQARQAAIPVIYANDNYGRWRSDWRQIVARATDGDAVAPDVASALAPSSDDYFVLKPRHSAFYQSPLDLLLGHLGARTVVLAGYAAEMCVLYTASDAYVRGYEVVLAEGCIAGGSDEREASALAHMREVMGASVVSPEELGDLLERCV